MPWNDPRQRPAVISASAARAAFSARSGVKAINALYLLSWCSMRASNAVAYSTGDSFFARISSAARRARDRRDQRSLRISLRPVDMRGLLRRRHAARQALQVTLHTGRRPLELLEVFCGQTIKPERAGLVTEFLGHRMPPLPAAASAPRPAL